MCCGKCSNALIPPRHRATLQFTKNAREIGLTPVGKFGRMRPQ